MSVDVGTYHVSRSARPTICICTEGANQLVMIALLPQNARTCSRKLLHGLRIVVGLSHGGSVRDTLNSANFDSSSRFV